MNNNNKQQKEEDKKPRVIVGLNFEPNPRRWWVPPGLEQTHDLPSNYKPVSFGAEKEYGPEEGWQLYTTRKQRQAARRRNRKRNPVYYQEPQPEDTYDFQDE